MGLFGGIKDANMNFGSNYAREGKYIVFIRKVEEGETRKGRGFVAVNKVVLEVMSGEDLANPHRVGEEITDMLMSDKDTFLGNFKSLVFSIMREELEDPDDIDEEACNLITSAEQPLAGKVVEVENIERIAKVSGKPYTLKRYIRSLPKEEIAERFTEEGLSKILTAEEMGYLGGKELS